MQHAMICTETDHAPEAASDEYLAADAAGRSAEVPLHVAGRELFAVSSSRGDTYALIAADAGYYWVFRATPGGVDRSHSPQYFSGIEAAVWDAAVHWEAQGRDPAFAETIRGSYDEMMEGLAG